MTVAEAALLAVVGLVTGVVNTLGGGGSLVTLPLLIAVGIPADVANGSNRVAVLLQSLGAAAAYRQSLGRSALEPVEWVPTLVGSALGALVAARIDPEAFERVVGVAMLLVLPTLFVRPPQATGRRVPHWARALGFLLVGAYGGFLQAGVGLFLLVAFTHLSGHDLVRANAGKVLMVAALTVPALLVFVLDGLVWWGPALALAAGATVGGWLGARWTVAWGPTLVRLAVVAVVLITSAKLLFAP